MNDLNQQAFIRLFEEAYRKCFGANLTGPLTETESKHFSNKIFEETGLVIGAKSIKNYSIYVLEPTEAKKENPSIATLDTLSRYVSKAPYTDEAKRKGKEGHFPYWYQYKSLVARGRGEEVAQKENQTIEKEEQAGEAVKARPVRRKGILIGAMAVLTVLVFFLFWLFYRSDKGPIADHFGSVREDSLENRGWIIQSKEKTWWDKRGIRAGGLTLYTLRGDNLADSTNAPDIKNLLLRKLNADCFTTEIRLDSFLPRQNWQQAGILLLEEPSLRGKSLRLSIGYNDFFGGYKKPKEILIQGIVSGGSDAGKPEEIIHLPLFALEPGQEELVYHNLRRSALKIEKKDRHFRLLYSTGPQEIFAFKEALQIDLPIRPKYVGIFALQGFVGDTAFVQAHFTYFSVVHTKCGE